MWCIGMVYSIITFCFHVSCVKRNQVGCWYLNVIVLHMVAVGRSPSPDDGFPCPVLSPAPLPIHVIAEIYNNPFTHFPSLISVTVLSSFNL